MTEPILKVEQVKKHFPIKKSLLKRETQTVKAVDGVSFDLFKGETLGVVGESGCGKSTLARVINQLIRPTEGTVHFHGKNLAGLSAAEVRKVRKHIQMVFQNPYASLDPRKTVGQLIMEPLVIHGVGTRDSQKKRLYELLETVGLNEGHAKRYPHEFSGGQRQRINIARALALHPDIIICDEPVSALDVSVQAQVINLLKDLQNEFQLTYVFISHDLNVVRYMCDRIAVMYLGKIVEMGTYEQIYHHPKQPYTKALLSAVPKESPFEQKQRTILSGDVPSPVNPPPGCPFHKRCPEAMPSCQEVAPTLIKQTNGQQVACHLMNDTEEEAICH
ncbi:ABC transporter ATP-binding protein [Shouchella clausii]|uniref:ABC transporter ATP-binding protein n=1 Tax=Shouchella clausii TaxID=79880 RepID=UPI000BA7C0A8|nr:dipeptide ABC transporter ATP-binding protein [Shouchella clausii]PAD47706.1 peptide ABC transporter substrate-binding protein [Shouchella clausii]